MARATNREPVEQIHGKLKKDEDVYYRWRNGKQFAVKMTNPRTVFSEKEKALHAGFGQLSKLASQIAKDLAKAAPYMDAFNAQKDKDGGQKSLYQFILTHFLREAKNDRTTYLKHNISIT